MSPLCEQQRTSAKAPNLWVRAQLLEPLTPTPSVRLGRIVHHVFAEVALLLVGAVDGETTLRITIPAAVDIFRRTGRNLTTLPAEGVVVLAQG